MFLGAVEVDVYAGGIKVWAFAIRFFLALLKCSSATQILLRSGCRIFPSLMQAGVASRPIWMRLEPTTPWYSALGRPSSEKRRRGKENQERERIKEREEDLGDDDSVKRYQGRKWTKSWQKFVPRYVTREWHIANYNVHLPNVLILNNFAHEILSGWKSGTNLRVSPVSRNSFGITSIKL